MSKLIVPVAAVADTVATSIILEVFISAFDEVPVKVCNPVNVFATFVTGMFAPASVLAPVPPLAIAKVPATVTAPLVAVAGVSPVDPKLIVVTPALAVDH